MREAPEAAAVSGRMTAFCPCKLVMTFSPHDSLEPLDPSKRAADAGEGAESAFTPRSSRLHGPDRQNGVAVLGYEPEALHELENARCAAARQGSAVPASLLRATDPKDQKWAR